MTNICILHYDDEIESVSHIAQSLLNIYLLESPNWVSDIINNINDEGVSFTLMPNPGIKYSISYRLYSKVDECENSIGNLSVQDIAVFDLMKDSNGCIETVGINLYEKVKTKLPIDRIFILSGFVNTMKSDPGHSIPESQLMLKPISSKEAARKIISRFPRDLHPRDAS
jgi:hypothetical protein